MLKKYLFLFLVFVFAGCTYFDSFTQEDETSTILLLYTNDEHGHIYENDGWNKAVALYEMWEDEEKNCRNCTVIKLSGGDSYTGTAVSTFFKGASMAEVMGLLGYKLSALGNHEFDFGEQELFNNSRLAKMPYISSNFVTKEKKTVFEPYLVQYAGKTKILFVAAITTDTKRISRAQPFVESDITDPLLPVSQAIEKENAEINIVVAHESYEDAQNWVKALPKKPLVAFTGHDHKEALKQIGGVFFVQNAGYLPSYAKVLIEKKGKEAKVVKAEIVPLKKEISLRSEGALKIEKTVGKYLEQLEKDAGQTLISAKRPLDTASLQKLFACSMLESFPECNVAISNPGGFRDTIKAGEVRKSDILSVFPFENFIVTAEIRGDDLLYNLSQTENAHCGAVKKKGKWFIGNAEIEDSKVYKVVTTDFLYMGGDGYRFTNPQGVTTTVSWRTPLENYLIGSSKKGLTLESAAKELIKGK
ncbi:bifunctional metallophosphatase/5'-nucleotidase [bacterium]|nr:bifunctional metallophosphatase/5'-nucleotidase [bacterium]